MSAVDLALPRLQTEEGFRGTAYRDTKGLLTIGYGCNIDAGWSKGLAQVVLAYQAGEKADALSGFDWFANLDEARQSVLVDLAFNMGLHSLLGFPHMLAALARKDWQAAHDELLASKWRTDVGDTRALPLANILLTGA